jgi:hypothetical protein
MEGVPIAVQLLFSLKMHQCVLVSTTLVTSNGAAVMVVTMYVSIDRVFE